MLTYAVSCANTKENGEFRFGSVYQCLSTPAAVCEQTTAKQSAHFNIICHGSLCTSSSSSTTNSAGLDSPCGEIGAVHSSKNQMLAYVQIQIKTFLFYLFRCQSRATLARYPRVELVSSNSPSRVRKHTIERPK